MSTADSAIIDTKEREVGADIEQYARETRNSCDSYRLAAHIAVAEVTDGY